MSDISTNDGVLTASEVADYLRLSRATVYRLTQAGVIPGVRVGRCWRFRRDLVDQWIAEQWQERQGEKREEQ